MTDTAQNIQVPEIMIHNVITDGDVPNGPAQLGDQQSFSFQMNSQSPKDPGAFPSSKANSSKKTNMEIFRNQMKKDNGEPGSYM